MAGRRATAVRRRRRSRCATGSRSAGVKRLEYKKGDRVRFVVSSDVSDEIHVHGYDLTKDVQAGGSVALRLPGRHRGRLRDRARGPRTSRSPSCASSPRDASAAAAGAARAALRRRLALPAAAFAHGLVGRADLPIPEWLFGWAAAVVLVVSFVAPRRRCGASRSWRTTTPSGPLPALAVAHARQPGHRGARRRGRRRAARARRLERPRRRPDRRRQLRADVRLRDLLGRPGSGQHPVRRRLPRLQPVARDRARRRVRRVRGWPARCRRPSPTRRWLGRWPAVATHPRLRLDRARLCRTATTRARSRSRRSSTRRSR